MLFRSVSQSRYPHHNLPTLLNYYKHQEGKQRYLPQTSYYLCCIYTVWQLDGNHQSDQLKGNLGLHPRHNLPTLLNYFEHREGKQRYLPQIRSLCFYTVWQLNPMSRNQLKGNLGLYPRHNLPTLLNQKRHREGKQRYLKLLTIFVVFIQFGNWNGIRCITGVTS